MTETTHKKPKKFRRIKWVIWIFLFLAVLLAIPAVLAVRSGISAPVWVNTQVEQRLNAAIEPMQIKIGSIDLKLAPGSLSPSLAFSSVRILDGDKKLRAILPKVQGRVDGWEFLMGRIRPTRLEIHAASLRLLRDDEGRFDISIGDAGSITGLTQDVTTFEQRVTVPDIVAKFENFLGKPFLQKLQKIQADDIYVRLDDALSKRNWQFRQGVMTFENNESALSANVTFELQNADEPVAGATFTFSKNKGQQAVDFSTRFKGVRAKDVADQVAALDWLRLLDAPIDGSVSLSVQPDGSFGDLFGVLNIGAGQLFAAEDTRPVKFISAKAYLTYEKDLEKLTFNQISIDTEAARIEAEGHAYLSDRIDRTIGAVIGQLNFTKVVVNPDGFFETPLNIDLGAVDMRVMLNPLKVDIGQMVLVDGDTRFVMHGNIAADEHGWTSALDMTVNRVSWQQALQFWPVEFRKLTRNWIEENIIAGSFLNVVGAMRAKTGEEPRFSLGFDIEDTDVRFMASLPPIQNGYGYGTLTGRQLDIVVREGTVEAPVGGAINIAGTSFTIPDVTIPEAPAEVRLKTESSVTAVLSLLDLPPFEFLAKAGRLPNIANGKAKVEGTIGLPLAKDLTFDQVTFTLNGQLSDLSSDKIVKDKVMTAREMSVFVDDAGLTISGDARLGQLPITGSWQQKFGPEYKGINRIEGQVEISQAFLKEFGIVLPEGSVSGVGSGVMTIDMAPGKAPEFRLISDLNRVGLRLDALGFVKPKNVTARLEVTGRFDVPLAIDKISLKTKGMEIVGSAEMNKDGSLSVLRLTQADIGGWLKTGVEIRTGANGGTDFTLTSGELDLRRSSFGNTGTKGVDNKIHLDLAKVILSDVIALHNVRGELDTLDGLSGTFTAQVNGGAEVKGVMASQAAGTAVRFTSSDAGAFFRSSGLFQSAVGGDFSLILAPTAVAGEYLGQMNAKRIRVRNASALAELLSAISVVGLLEQLGGVGIAFNSVDARFKLSSKGVFLTESSAVGASLGITMQGAYNFSGATMDMRGVVTPIYMLNGLLEQTKIFGGLFGKQKGEGLFGFNYTLKGAADDPRVSVNPLSILTPGLFREIFKQPLPEVSQ